MISHPHAALQSLFYYSISNEHDNRLKRHQIHIARQASRKPIAKLTTNIGQHIM